MRTPAVESHRQPGQATARRLVPEAVGQAGEVITVVAVDGARGVVMEPTASVLGRSGRAGVVRRRIAKVRPVGEGGNAVVDSGTVGR